MSIIPKTNAQQLGKCAVSIPPGSQTFQLEVAAAVYNNYLGGTKHALLRLLWTADQIVLFFVCVVAGRV